MDEQQNTPEQAPVEPTPVQPAPAPVEAPTEDKKGGYGKRPLWQWVLIYLVVGGALYYVIYLLFFAGKATGGGY
jgi:hypothetical protein